MGAWPCSRGTRSCGRRPVGWPRRRRVTGASSSSRARPASARRRSPSRSRGAAGSARVAVGACDGTSTPAPLGPLVEMLPELPPGSGRRAVAPGRLRALVAALRARRRTSRTCSSSRMPTGVTSPPSTSCCTSPAGSTPVGRWSWSPTGLRTSAATHLLRRVLGDAATATGTRRLDLGPLSPAAVGQLAAAATAGRRGRPAPPDRGNPFFVTEVLAAGSAAVPPTVRDACWPVGPARSRPGAPWTSWRWPGPVLSRPARRLPSATAWPPSTSRSSAGPAAGRQRADVPARAGPGRRRRAGPGRRTRCTGGPRALTARDAGRPGPAGPPRRRRGRRGAPSGSARGRGRAPPADAHREAAQQYRRVLRNADRLREPLTDRRRADLLGLLAYECYLTNLVDDALAARQEALAIWSAVGDGGRVGDTPVAVPAQLLRRQGDLAEHHARCAVEALAGADSVELAMAYSNMAQCACSTPTSPAPAGGAGGRWMSSGGSPRPGTGGGRGAHADQPRHRGGDGG